MLLFTTFLTHILVAVPLLAWTMANFASWPGWVVCWALAIGLPVVVSLVVALVESIIAVRFANLKRSRAADVSARLTDLHAQLKPMAQQISGAGPERLRPLAVIRGRCQFDLATLVWFMTLCGIFASTIATDQWTVFFLVLPASIVVAIATCRLFAMKSPFLRRFTVAVVGAICISAVFPHSESRVRVHRYGRPYTEDGINSLQFALDHYYEKFHCFPPPVVRDENGRPMHSWRAVLFPPHLGSEDEGLKYRFDEPWNSKHNLQFCYATPGELGFVEGQTPRSPAGRGMTAYLAIVGPGTLFGLADKEPGNLIESSDLQIPTIDIVEAPDLAVNWLEPRDLTVDELIALLARDAEKNADDCNLNSRMVQGFTHDGRFDLSCTLDPTIIRSLALVDGSKDLAKQGLRSMTFGIDARPIALRRLWLMIMSLLAADLCVTLFAKAPDHRHSLGSHPPKE